VLVHKKSCRHLHRDSCTFSLSEVFAEHSPNKREPDPQKTIKGRQLESPFLVPALENEKLMAQGENFCLQSCSGTERITKNSQEESQNWERHQSLLPHRAKCNQFSENELLGRHTDSTLGSRPLRELHASLGRQHNHRRWHGGISRCAAVRKKDRSGCKGSPETVICRPILPQDPFVAQSCESGSACPPDASFSSMSLRKTRRQLVQHSCFRTLGKGCRPCRARRG
jgi:hypothetical protein